MENIDPNILVTVSQIITPSMAAVIDKLSTALTKTMLGFVNSRQGDWHALSSFLFCEVGLY